MYAKCVEKLGYTKCKFNVHKNQQSQQTGSRNLMGPTTLPTIWGTYMKHLKLPTTEPKQVKMCWNGPFLLIYMAAPASIQNGYVLLPKIEIGNFI
jgi:hypothetical protein